MSCTPKGLLESMQTVFHQTEDYGEMHEAVREEETSFIQAMLSPGMYGPAAMCRNKKDYNRCMWKDLSPTVTVTAEFPMLSFRPAKYPITVESTAKIGFAHSWKDKNAGGLDDITEDFGIFEVGIAGGIEFKKCSSDEFYVVDATKKMGGYCKECPHGRWAPARLIGNIKVTAAELAANPNANKCNPIKCPENTYSKAPGSILYKQGSCTSCPKGTEHLAHDWDAAQTKATCTPLICTGTDICKQGWGKLRCGPPDDYYEKDGTATDCSVKAGGWPAWKQKRIRCGAGKKKKGHACVDCLTYEDCPDGRKNWIGDYFDESPQSKKSVTQDSTSKIMRKERVAIAHSKLKDKM